MQVEIRGSVISTPLAVNAMKPSIPLDFAKSGLQKPESFESEPKVVLEAAVNGEAFAQSGLSLSSTLADEEKIEINSVV